MKYKLNHNNIANWHKLTGYYPVRTSIADLLRKQGWFQGNPLQVVAFGQSLSTKPNIANAGALTGAHNQMRSLIEQNIQKVLSGQGVNEVPKVVSEQVGAALLEYNKNFR